MSKPIVALVGRPNVGKSTLFNRLVGERLAIVDDVPGTTRDRIYAECTWNGRYFGVVDTGGIDPTHGGKAVLSVGSADFIEEIKTQAMAAVEEADAVLFLVDGESGVTPPDREVADDAAAASDQQRRTVAFTRPIFLVVNKCETPRRRAAAVEFFELGLGEPHAVSAVHGTDVGDLLDELVAGLPESETQEDESIKIAIVGKPNCGQVQPAQPAGRARNAPSSAQWPARPGMPSTRSSRWPASRSPSSIPPASAGAARSNAGWSNSACCALSRRSSGRTWSCW